MANEYLDKEGLKRLVSLLKDELKSTTAELKDEMNSTASELRDEMKKGAGVSEERVQELIDEKIGDIETALDVVIAIQNSLIGGGV